MEYVVIYLAKVSLLIAIFYGAYRLLLQNLTFYTINRYFLLFGIFVSLLLPLFFIKKYIIVEPVINSISAHTIHIQNNYKSTQYSYFQIDWYAITILIYIIVMLWFAFKLIRNIYFVFTFLYQEKSNKNKGYSLINTQKNVESFSFFNYIVINKEMYSKFEYNAIIQHEKAHCKQWHSIDVIVANLLCVFFWFNPLSWYFKKAIIQNTEYLADKEATKNISDKVMYQKLLLNIVCGKNNLSIINHFNQSLIKKRIVMLNKNQSKTVNFWRYFLVFPMVATFMFLFQQKVVAQIAKQETQVELIGLSWDKNATDTEFKNDEKITQEQGVTLKFKNIERNANNEITSIDIYFKDEVDGEMKMQNFNNPNGIETIYFKRKYDQKTGHYFFGFVSDKETFEEEFPSNPIDSNSKIAILTLDSKDPDEGFYSLKNEFKEYGITIKVWGIKRNSKNEIIEIHAQMKNERGKIKEFHFENTKKPLESLEFWAPKKGTKSGDDFDVKEGVNTNVSKLELLKEEKQKNKKAWIEYYKLQTKNKEMLEDMKKNMLIIVNGKEFFQKDFQNFKFESDGTIIHYDSKDAIEKFGEKAKDGALVFTGNTTVCIKERRKNEVKDNYIIIEDPTGDEILLVRKQNEVGVKVPRRPFINADENPLIAVNGKIIEENAKEYLEKINPETISNMDVLSSEKAIEKYGKKAANGAIEIKLK